MGRTDDDWTLTGMNAMSSRFLVWLYEDDLAVIITVDGKFFGIWSNKPEECYQNADELQDWMSTVMLDPDHTEGCWMWRIKVGHQEMEGEYIGGSDD